jgi:transposase-like protein
VAYVYRAIDQFGQIIDVFVTPQRDAKAVRWFFEWAFNTTKVMPVEVTTDRAATYPVVMEDLLLAAWHRTEQHANNRVEADHGRLRPDCDRCEDSSRTLAPGSSLPHAFVQNVRRGHNELAVEVPAGQRLTVAFDDLALAI